MARLERRRRLYYAVRDIPTELQGQIGKRRFLKSTGTGDADEARRVAATFDVFWLEKLQAAKAGPTAHSQSHESTEARVLKEAAWWRRRIASAANEQTRRKFLEQMKEAASEYVNPDDPTDEAAHDLANLFVEAAEGNQSRTSESLDEYLAMKSRDLKAKTADLYRTSLERFCTRFERVADVSPRAVRNWVTDMRLEGMSDNTLQRNFSAVRGYWQHLKDAGLAPDDVDPFAGALKNTNKSKNRVGIATPYKPFSDVDVVTLLRAARHKGDDTLANLITLGMWTGCRIGSLCLLRVSDVNGDSFEVDDKTRAGERTVPIHKELQPLIDKLCATSTDGFVLSGLTTNKYGNRADAVGKRFGHLKTALGHQGRQWAFHSIRKTVVTQLQRADVPEEITMSIVGHENDSLTYGLYSDGPSLEQKRSAIGKLQYPL
ncbi:tyrosine-type recombinase/integrase [Shimia sp. R9_2]|uniref:tyrosine-type recombinase/integrase n=1 Tax=Shimia sp. R9_2 TaxID=2821112 RepID=UPI001ADC72BC|nr:tyrosine-type recombinase/integrase [Shimia sp. R9_2]MBO9398785.1 tyrosine-type recombinase/integrase [Shimia sp. R9_2]